MANVNKKSFKVSYNGSLFWLIFWVICFFPIALALFFTASSFNMNESVYHLEYNGSRFWLGFWVLVFFPVSFFLLFFNGMSITVEKPETTVIT